MNKSFSTKNVLKADCKRINLFKDKNKNLQACQNKFKNIDNRSKINTKNLKSLSQTHCKKNNK